MNVTLLSYTPDALTLLLATKQTRLSMSPKLLDEVRAWPDRKKQEELDYMRGTIQSSWEFVDYTFLIDGVTRAFTHQLVRTRAGSYAQQSQRTVDMSGFDYVETGVLNECGQEEKRWTYQAAMDDINEAYNKLIDMGVPPQDARGILPTNICTNIVSKFSLRTLADMAKVRLCTRTQGEYQDVFRAMRAEVIKVHPWAEPFIRVACAATGVCCFPNNTECPIKGMTFNPDSGERWDLRNEGYVPELDQWIPAKPATREEIQQAWEQVRFEARPKETK
jgi:flavin-dependent thymidylate synthase